MMICGQEFSESIIERIKDCISKKPELSRVQLSKQVCEWLEWKNNKGKFKDMSCRVALLKLARKGEITLPEKPRIEGKAKEFGKGELIPITEDLCCDLDKLGKIQLIQIRTAESKLSYIWNQLMEKYHYLGKGPLCGAQMRYLIQSEHYGWMGGFAYSASAWRIEAREEWIGWDEESRKRHLQEVICNSRFLILPQVKVPNLASHVLSLSLQRLSMDWQERYGINPLLVETFVERDCFEGTCYKASNWIYVGATKGRGRQDIKTNHSISVKDIYIYPLRSSARDILCDGRKQVEQIEVKVTDWAEEEFGNRSLGDRRLDKRILTIARDFYARPQANVPEACGSRAKTKAAYRFFDHEKTTMDKILTSHYESTTKRIEKEKIVLAVQDTTTLNYSAHPATENLGLIGSSKDSCIGLIVHDTIAFNVEGTPLGLLDVQCWARDPKEFGKKHLRHHLPIEEKESCKWLKSYRAVSEVQKQCPNTKLVSIGDREADIYELFAMASEKADNPFLLVRAEHDRMLAEGHVHLWDYITGEPIVGVQEIKVPRRGSQKARKATLSIRFSEVTLKPPDNKKDLNQLKIWAVMAQEEAPFSGVNPLEWMLLTTSPVKSFENALEILKWYCLRWGIEIYHRTLKSGCKIESRQLGHADRIEACLAIDMVIAWRILHLTKLGRETPEVPCTVFFEEEEWKALVAYKTQNQVPPKETPTLREVIRLTASLGGFLGRKGDGEPGAQTIWIGLQRLDDITAMYKVFTWHVLDPPVSSKTYG